MDYLAQSNFLNYSVSFYYLTRTSTKCASLSMDYMENHMHEKFSLQAITVDMGFPEAAEGLLPIRRLCEYLDVPYTVVPSQII